MKKPTLKALQDSIQKWEAIVDGTGEDKGADNCALCALFWDDGFCADCPVKTATGEPGCDATPYFRFRFADDIKRRQKPAGTPYGAYSWRVGGPESKHHATEMLNFLKALVPAGKAP